MIMTSLRPEFRRELRIAKKVAKQRKLRGVERAALLDRAYQRHVERKLSR